MGQKEQLERAFQTFLANNRTWPEGTLNSYGISVESIQSQVNSAGVEIRLAFRFLQGKIYCCTELGCHFMLADGASWQRLRDLMRQVNMCPEGPIVLRVRVVVEAGAIANGQVVPEHRACQVSFQEVVDC